MIELGRVSTETKGTGSSQQFDPDLVTRKKIV